MKASLPQCFFVPLLVSFRCRTCFGLDVGALNDIYNGKTMYREGGPIRP